MPKLSAFDYLKLKFLFLYSVGERPVSRLKTAEK